mmetsp:Transcript_48327/g.100969  ORF Transcript_48327/g.100969 Transcript_48327/m.100969 type:complete len:87 (-) Transcript_48327:986-1246(-)
MLHCAATCRNAFFQDSLCIATRQKNCEIVTAHNVVDYDRLHKKRAFCGKQKEIAKSDSFGSTMMQTHRLFLNEPLPFLKYQCISSS